jgi:hypothetical protein
MSEAVEHSLSGLMVALRDGDDAFPPYVDAKLRRELLAFVDWQRDLAARQSEPRRRGELQRYTNRYRVLEEKLFQARMTGAR